jgi:hypothetical protein
MPNPHYSREIRQVDKFQLIGSNFLEVIWGKEGCNLSIENEKKMCKLPAEMTHNRFDFLHDIEIPLHQFLDSVESVALFQRQMNQQDSNITL